MSFAQVNGVKLYYERHGQGPEVLVIPGIPAIVSDCLPLIEGLSDAFTVTVYDNRGSGQSDAPDDPYSMELLTRDAAGLLGDVGVSAAHIIGFSMGGMIAQHLALGFPETVRSLVLACAHAGLAHAIPPPADVAKAFQQRTPTWRDRIEALAPYAFAAGFPEGHPEQFAAFIEKKSRDEQTPHGYRRQLEAVIAHDTYERLPEIPQHTLVMTGSEDRVVPAANSRLLAMRIPNADLCVIEGAGHLFFAEKPRETIGALRKFLLEREE